jgi:hypothetical protein
MDTGSSKMPPAGRGICGNLSGSLLWAHVVEKTLRLFGNSFPFSFLKS